MDIKHISQLNELLEQLTLNTLNQDDYLRLDGLAKYKDHIFKATQAIDSPELISKLSSEQLKLKNTLSSYEPEIISKLSNAMMTSYYTPDHIAEQMSNAIIGFSRKTTDDVIEILEPSAGTGALIKAFKDPNIKVTAIEKEIITSDILSHNARTLDFPVKVINKSFEKVEPSQFDIVLGNVPFGDIQVFDPNIQHLKDKYHGKIHNYFFVRAIEELKPGGVLGLITTASMIDQGSSMNLRQFIVENTNIINISRLDSSTFNDAGTKITTDLIVLQKPKIKKQELNAVDKTFLTNVRFEEKSHNAIFTTEVGKVYGEFAIEQGYLGRPTLVVKPSDTNKPINNVLYEDIVSALELRADYIKTENKTLENSSLPTLGTQSILDQYPNHAMGNIIYFSGSFYTTAPDPQNINEILLNSIRIPPGSEEKTFSIIELRDTYKKITLAIREKNSIAASKYQQEFQNTYDRFNFMYGELNLAPNKQIWSKDSDSDMIQALEVHNGKYYELSNLLTKKITLVEDKIEENLDIENAVVLSLNLKGRINEELIETRYQKNWIKEALDKKLVFLNPIITDFKTVQTFELCDKSEFQSGYVEGKLKAYSEISKLNNPYGKYLTQNHIYTAKQLLKEVLPIRLTVDIIDPSLGENWMPLSIYEAFAQHLFQDDSTTINFIPQVDVFQVKSSYSTYKNSNFSVERTSGRTISHATMLQYALQQNVPQLTMTVFEDDKKKQVFDQVSFDKAQIIFKKINTAFSKWIREEKQQVLYPRIEEIYHRTNNAIVKREFIAEKITFPDMNPKFIPRSLQSNCAWEMAQNNGGIIDHKVGFGKTVSMAMSNQLKKRFGTINKEIIACLNANYVKVYHEFKEVYPKGNFMLVTTEDMDPKNRLKTLYKIANTDCDAIICAHSSLMKFPPSPETQKMIYSEIIEETTSTLDADRSDQFLTRGARGQMEKKLASAEAKFEQALFDINSKKDSKLITWEDLQIDSIVIDESQFFKNLTFSTRHTNVAGLGSQKETQKTSNLLIYIRSCQEAQLQRNGMPDQGATFVSGTILANSITELYLVHKYLTPAYFQSKDINCFDQWARQYARKEISYEMSLDGTVKLKERFRYFDKAPEIAADYARITNYADDNTFEIEKPEIKHHLINIEPTSDQKEYFDHLKRFAKTKNPENLIGVSDTQNIRKASGLIATSQGRKAALDMRLISNIFQDSPGSKINVMARNAKKIYDQFDNDKGTQLIFCDSGTPTSKNVNLYQHMKDSLMKLGVPEKEIAFVHSYTKAKKSKLYQDVNLGRIRFLLGSTQTLGVGVNVQRKLVGLHHMDFPWRPTDLEQRNGRGDRPGNILLPKFDNTINTYYYATKNSLDAYTLNILQIKQSFIEQFKNANAVERSFDEGAIDSSGNIPIDMFQSIVSGDDSLLQKQLLEKQLITLNAEFGAFKQEQRKREWNIQDIQSQISKDEPTLEKIKKDLALSASITSDLACGKVTLNDVTYHNNKESGTIIHDFITEKTSNPNSGKELTIDKDFNFIVTRSNKDEDISIFNYEMLIQTPNNLKIGYSYKQLYKDPENNVTYISNVMAKLKDLELTYEKRIRTNKVDLSIYKTTNEEKFPDEYRIKEIKETIQFLNEKIEKSNPNDNSNEDNNINKNISEKKIDANNNSEKAENGHKDKPNDNDKKNDNDSDNKPNRGPRM